MRIHLDKTLSDVLFRAAKGDIDAVRAHLARTPDLLNAKSPGHTRTLLWEATCKNRLAPVAYLVERGADVNIVGRYRNELFVLLKPYSVAQAYH